MNETAQDVEETGTELERVVAGVLSTFPPFDHQHPSTCLPMARAVVAAIGDWEPSDAGEPL